MTPTMAFADQKSDKRVLVIDDSGVYRHLTVAHLRDWGFEVSVANNISEGWKVLEQPSPPALVFLDSQARELDIAEFCRKIRERKYSETYVYSILLTTKESRSELLKAMENGIDDYLVKPFDERELQARLLVGTRNLSLRKELLAARDSARRAVTSDGLTGAMNRRDIVEFLRRELTRASRNQRPLSVILADIDHFKDVNDQLGPLAGDEVLKEVGRRLRSSLRAYDGVGRYGGEEFLLVLPGCDLTNLLIRADQIRSFVCNKPIATTAKPKTVTVSMGVAFADGTTEMDPQSLLHQAEAGLGKAKRRGRNRVEQVDETDTKALGVGKQ